MKHQLVEGIGHEFEQHLFWAEGYSCRIVPRWGGSMQELVVNNTQIILGCPLNTSGYAEYLKFCRSGILFPFPNRIEDGRYQLDSTEFELAINDTEFGHAIHGLVFDRKFEVAEVWDDGIQLVYEHTAIPGFPFDFKLQLNYSFIQAGVILTFLATNTGEGTMPMGFGWHPYFLSSDNCHMELMADRHYLCDDRMIPKQAKTVEFDHMALQDHNLDDAYRLTSETVTLFSDSFVLDMILPRESYLQLYTPADRRSVAIEPMSCIANAFNNGVGKMLLEPEKSCAWTVKVSIRQS